MEMTTKNASKPALGPVRLMKEEKEEAGWRRGEGGGRRRRGGNPDSDEHVKIFYHLHFCSSMKAMGEKEKLEGRWGGGGRRKSPGGGRGGNYDRHHQEEEEGPSSTSTTKLQRKPA